MHRFHSISIRILFSKHGSPFASFTFHMLSHKYTMDFNAGITRIKRTKRKTRPKRSIRSLGMGWSLPRGPASNPTTSGVSRFSVWPFAEQIGWKPFLLTFFTTFFQSTGKKHLRLGWLKRTSHTPAKPKSCCCIPEPVMKNAWENSSMMLDKTWWWCFFVLFFSRQGLLASYWSWVDWWEWKLKKVKSQWRNNGSGMSWNFAYLSVSLKVDVLNLIDSVASSNSSTSWKQTCHITCVFFRNIPCFSCLISTRCPWDIIYKTPHKSGHQPRFPSTPMIGLHRWWEATAVSGPHWLLRSNFSDPEQICRHISQDWSNVLLPLRSVTADFATACSIIDFAAAVTARFSTTDCNPAFAIAGGAALNSLLESTLKHQAPNSLHYLFSKSSVAAASASKGCAWRGTSSVRTSSAWRAAGISGDNSSPYWALNRANPVESMAKSTT